MQTTPQNLSNAWIYLEHDIFGTKYDDPDSSYQSLIKYDVYQSIDILYMYSVKIVPTSAYTIPQGDGSSYTLQTDSPIYMKNLTRDAKENNSNIKLGVTLASNDKNMINQLFVSDDPKRDINRFASNLYGFMSYYKLNALDVFWDNPISEATGIDHFKYFFSIISENFRNWNGTYYLSLSPATNRNTDTATINNYIDFVNLRLGRHDHVLNLFRGVIKQLFTYGAEFEAPYIVKSKFDDGPQTALDAYIANTENFQLKNYINWCLNTRNFMFEQTQQQVLYALIHNNYKVQIDLGELPENPINRWTFGYLKQHVIKLNIFSDDHGETLKGTLQYDSIPEMEVIATLVNKYTYMVKEAYYPSAGSIWKPSGTWLMGLNPRRYLKAINISSFNHGQTLKGTITYIGEDPQGFYAELQAPGT